MKNIQRVLMHDINIGKIGSIKRIEESKLTVKFGQKH